MALPQKSSEISDPLTSDNLHDINEKEGIAQHFGKNLRPWKRIVFICCGSVSLALGLIGIPVPLLPTTPLVLLAAWFFAMSSKRYYIWLTSHRVFGRIITDYREKGGVRRIIKIRALTLLWVTILTSTVFFTDKWLVRFLLLIIAVGVTLHIQKIKTLK